MLPAGFTAGAITTDVNPQDLLGAAFQPLVSLAVAVILYDAGMSLDLRKLHGHTRRVVVRLIAIGVPVTLGFAAVFAGLLLDMSSKAALMLGAILVVSGPTVVGPLLVFIRPTERLQRVLSWEGSLIDPVGGILGAVIFHAVLASTRQGFGYQLAQFLAGVCVGLAGGIAGTALLWLLLRKLRLGEVLGTNAQLASVIAVAAACDILRDDAGLISAIVMGLAVANLRGFDVPARRPFFETLVQLIIGVLFISISATVTPAALQHLVLPALGLIAVLVLITRPLVALLATAGTDMTPGERRFTGWMAPRGIVAAAPASTFSAALVSKNIEGASKILPVTFLIIVVTVAAYGLTAVPVARRLGVTRPARARPLLVGGEPWVVDLGRALGSLGLEVLMWAGLDEQRQRIRKAGLELAPGELLATATGRGAQLEGVTAVLLLTDEDDFNALGSTVLQGSVEEPVYRLGARRPSHGVVAPCTGGQILFDPRLTRYEIGHRYADGARIQGFILRGYRMPMVRHFLLTVGTPAQARRQLGRFVSGDESDVPQITTAEDWQVGFAPGPGDDPAAAPRRTPDYCLNIGVTWPGLVALEMEERVPALSFKSFGAFTEGAAQRAESVGDTGPSSPGNWIAGFGTGRDHVLVTLHAISPEAMEGYTDRVRAWLAEGDAFREIWRQDGMALMEMQDGKPVPTSKIHFGYTDGITYPAIRGGPVEYRPDHQRPCEPWLFVLREDAENYDVPEPLQLGLNGSFAVFKKVETDVVGFEDFLQSNKDKIDPELLAAKMCGRWRNGVPLALSPDTDSPAGGIPPEQLNNFGYVDADGTGDPKGIRCPVGAHIRRVNPRGQPVQGQGLPGGSNNSHRLIRRGMPYGPAYDPGEPYDGIERGMLFHFINANIENQYEFVLRQWANDSEFAGAVRLHPKSKDPLIGTQNPAESIFVIPQADGGPPVEVTGLSSFVTTKAAAYVFLPSITAIKFIANLGEGV